MTISPLRDSETLRQQRNLTTTQKRASTETKEGVLVNNFIKDCPDCKVNLEDTCDTSHSADIDQHTEHRPFLFGQKSKQTHIIFPHI